MEGVVDGKSLPFSTAYMIRLRPPLRDRVKDLTEYSNDSDGTTLGGIADSLPPEGRFPNKLVLSSFLNWLSKQNFK